MQIQRIIQYQSLIIRLYMHLNQEIDRYQRVELLQTSLLTMPISYSFKCFIIWQDCYFLLLNTFNTPGYSNNIWMFVCQIVVCWTKTRTNYDPKQRRYDRLQKMKWHTKSTWKGNVCLLAKKKKIINQIKSVSCNIINKSYLSE